jgi:hypothetical protein
MDNEFSHPELSASPHVRAAGTEKHVPAPGKNSGLTARQFNLDKTPTDT